MPLRVPPGRAGRTWLARRLEIARGGAEVLDEKRRVLLREQLRLAPVVAEAQAEWEGLAADAAVWLARATVLSGPRRLRLARPQAEERAELHVRTRRTPGVSFPESPKLRLPAPLDVARVGGSAALGEAETAHRRALEAAARLSVARLALDRVVSELDATTLRLRAIEHRWIPRHERALAVLEVALDEGERQEALRARWAADRASGRDERLAAG